MFDIDWSTIPARVISTVLGGIALAIIYALREYISRGLRRVSAAIKSRNEPQIRRIKPSKPGSNFGRVLKFTMALPAPAELIDVRLIIKVGDKWTKPGNPTHIYIDGKKHLISGPTVILSNGERYHVPFPENRYPGGDYRLTINTDQGKARGNFTVPIKKN